ncbi:MULTISPECIES: cation:proton antiporter domain-containing protein [unclassified Sphingomonas]|uniref:cation:proton antiporter domain-containing protein n=1 Tax=unclassified Sphingomonas TaxID=196159 RepID=UPI0006F63CC2|nr:MULTISPECIES: cation:proton antiporter [unclassified Sphingomonas]KQX20241.1 sodium:proton exchanger [Sphingomonas sp. Root1294]KQY67491.1 sodium:proton exchanger [Sphingomonas sp. Root50]KRB90869.1 sodium:proton exchanger [Sphingomonas sp. Root720]
MSEAADPLLLRDGVLLLGAAIVSVLIFRRLGLGATLGYLVAGAAIGPQGFGLIGDAESKLGIAELGIVLLLFLVGLELNPNRLWRLRRDIFGLGLLQVVTCGIALSAVIYFGTAFTPAAAIALGLPLALSSTAQVLPMLRSAGRMNTPSGERAFSVLLFQDLSLIPLITIIAALSRTPPAPDAPPGWLLGVYTVVAVSGLVLAGRFVINPLFRLVGRLGERELFVAAGLFTVLASAAVMEALHLSTALGAFVAGVMLADSPYRHELEADVEPFRTILLGLFFIAVGMLLDLHVIAERPLFVIAMAMAVVATKTTVMFGVAKLFGVSNRGALGFGLLLSQGGEFAFVLFAQANEALLIRPEAASLFGAIVTLSMATTPFLMMFANRFLTPPPTHEERPGPDGGMSPAAIVVGYGRFGQTVAQMLMAAGIRVSLIDNETEQIDVAEKFGSKVFYGDGTRVDLLRQAGADQARAIIFCLDGDGLGKAQLQPVLSAFPNAAVLVRAFDRRHMMVLARLDIAGAVRELFESAVVLGREALEAVGVSDANVEKVEAEYRRRDGSRLEAQIAAGDLTVRRDMMFNHDRKLDLEAGEDDDSGAG